MKKQKIKFSCLTTYFQAVIDDINNGYASYIAFFEGLSQYFASLQKHLDGLSKTLKSSNVSPRFNESVTTLTNVTSKVEEKFFTTETKDLILKFQNDYEKYKNSSNMLKDGATALSKEMRANITNFQILLAKTQKANSYSIDFHGELIKFYTSFMSQTARGKQLIEQLIHVSKKAISRISTRSKQIVDSIKKQCQLIKKHKSKSCKEELHSITELKKAEIEQFAFEKVLEMYVFPHCPTVIHSQLQVPRVNYFELQNELNKKVSAKMRYGLRTIDKFGRQIELRQSETVEILETDGFSENVNVQKADKTICTVPSDSIFLKL